MPRGNILGRDLRVDCRCRGGEVVENFHVIVGGQLFPELGKHLLNAQSEAPLRGVAGSMVRESFQRPLQSSATAAAE